MSTMIRDDDGGGSHHHRPYFPSQRSNGSDGPTHSPFDLNSHFNTTAFKSQGGFLSDYSMDYPFTNAQWKELERQAMIYKYMVASIPIPLDLLLPISPNSSTTPTISSAPNLRYINGKADMEPGRCKRTDGKKWRCSRDVAPNQKYCERHMNRGRPRSRKHVEQQQQQQTCLNDNNIPKKPRHETNHLSIDALPRSNNNNNNHNNNNNNNNGSTSVISQNSHFLGVEGGSIPPYHQYPYINNFEYSRNLEWVVKAEQQQQWLQLIQSKMEITENPHEGLEEETFLNLNRDCTALFLTPNDNNSDVVSDQPSRCFIDAWSKTTTTKTIENSETTDAGNLSPSSLTLSMGNWVNPNPSSCSWVSPLAEVLRPSSSTVAGDGGDSGSPPVTSPSGVLQKTTMTSLSDSSNCSSPKIKPEIALF